MRTFIAIEVPPDIQSAVASYVEIIKPGIPEVKWVAPEHLHLTIKFLGDIPEAGLPALHECIRNVADSTGPFTLELSHVGVFPTEQNPKVIWIGADGDLDHLLELYQGMEDCLERLGYDREAKTFSPHLTLGRVKRFVRPIRPETIPDIEPVSFDVTGLSIMKSTLTPQGPIYERLHEAEFAQASAHEF